MNKQKPNIFSYHEYSPFIKDSVKFLNKTDKTFNLKELSTKLGITSSYLSMILSSKRDLNLKLIPKISEIFELNNNETIFFELLVNFNDSKGDISKSNFFEQMKKFKNYQKLNFTVICLTGLILLSER